MDEESKATEPVATGDAKAERQPGSLKGKLVVGPEFFEPLPDEELAYFDSSLTSEP